MDNLTIQNINGRLYVDSREVAEMTGKAHNLLLRDIKKYKETLDANQNEPSAKMNSANFFVPATYKDANNQDRPCFLLTRKGCDMVANKMTGTKGILFTAAYVTKFEEMEKQLSQPQLSAEQIKAQLLLNIYNGGQEGVLASKQLADIEVQEKTKELTEVIEIQAPKVEAYTQFMDSDGLINLDIAADLVGIGKNKMLQILRLMKIFKTHHYINRAGVKCTGENHNTPYSAYDKYFKTKILPPSKINGISYSKVYVKPEGIDYIKKKIDEFQNEAE